MTVTDFKKTLSLFWAKAVEFIVYGVTLPWLTPFIAWMVVSSLVIIISTEKTIQLSTLVPGDFSNFFTYTSSWIYTTIIYFSALIISFITRKKHGSTVVLTLSMLFVLFLAFLYLLWGEMEVFIKIKS